MLPLTIAVLSLPTSAEWWQSLDPPTDPSALVTSKAKACYYHSKSEGKYCKGNFLVNAGAHTAAPSDPDDPWGAIEGEDDNEEDLWDTPKPSSTMTIELPSQ